MSKRLVICCDGTWNSPDQVRGNGPAPTNVVKMALAVAPFDSAGREQRTLYHRGIGTHRWERVRGGVFGFGLSRDVRNVYRFLVRNFEPGDEIFLFGFSRGAYIARSAAGLVRNCGILRAEQADRLDEAYALYRSRAGRTNPRAIEAQLFRRSYAHETRIRFIGVWDTVGALGIPFSGLRLVNLINRRWQFHDTELSPDIDAAYQALAIDERRGPFRPAIWTHSGDADGQVCEQVWFAGAHSDIGGGCADPTLAEISLLWMADRARSRGLGLRPDVFVPLVAGAEQQRCTGRFVAPDPNGPLHESRTGFYRLLSPFVRALGHTDGAREYVASTAVDRHRRGGYAPPNLVAHLEQGSQIMPVDLDFHGAGSVRSELRGVGLVG